MKKAEREALLRQRLAEMKQYEDSLYGQGIEFIAGVDEVGRGPLAGPVVAACVVLPQNFSLLGVDDSKKLSEKKRVELASRIKEEALVYALGITDNFIIDEINILQATKKAMAQAIFEADRQLEEKTGSNIQHILIDALTLEGVEFPQTGIVKGDSASVSIAAASIVAKVARDEMMEEYAKQYPDYSFERNKGYGTKAHYEGISRAGICEIHRRSFLKNIQF